MHAKAERMYARAMNELLELLHADPKRPDYCFAVFKKALYQYHVGYHVIKGGTFDDYPCTLVILTYLDHKVVTDRAVAASVTSLVPLRMSK